MLQITFRHMTSTDTLRILAEEKFEKLQAHGAGPVRCHLVIDCRSGHNRRGAAFNAHADLKVGLEDVRIEAHADHDLAAGAVRDVFAHLQRQLESRVSRKAEGEHAHAPGRAEL